MSQGRAPADIRRTSGCKLQNGIPRKPCIEANLQTSWLPTVLTMDDDRLEEIGDLNDHSHSSRDTESKKMAQIRSVDMRACSA